MEAERILNKVEEAKERGGKQILKESLLRIKTRLKKKEEVSKNKSGGYKTKAPVKESAREKKRKSKEAKENKIEAKRSRIEFLN